jgi:propanol-preferring alcohol dehydrogenase
MISRNEWMKNLSRRVYSRWEELAQSRPGRRFIESYQRRAERPEHPWRAVFVITLGVVLIGIGLLFSVTPVVPGFVFIALGLALIASRWKALAWFLDQTELHFRTRVRKHAPQSWTRSPYWKDSMPAMVLEAPGAPLALREMPQPHPGPGQLLIRVAACGVCRTDLHVVDGELPDPKLPLIPGHEIVGRVVAVADDIQPFAVGDRVGIPWLGFTCGRCRYCVSGRENLCDEARFTGYTLDGGYARYALADARYCFPIPEGYADAEAAPLLCAGLIGYRALKLAGDDAKRLGIYGFGAAAHLVAQVARYQNRDVYAFTRPGDEAAQHFARELGVHWTGDSNAPAPVPLDAAIIFAPVGSLVPQALQNVVKGGTVVCAGIHMSDIPAFPYRELWGERVIRSVANLTRRDAEEFLSLAPRVPVRTHIETLNLEQANEALARLRDGTLTGAAVLVVEN